MAHDVPTDEQVFRLIYRSRVRVPPGQRRTELGRLFSTARSRNKQAGITGALLLSDERFVQTLEGEEAAVRALFSTIEADPRHAEVTLLGAGTVGARVFARWSMARVADGGEGDLPLIAHADGIAVAAPRGTATAEQERVLEVMRDAARTLAPVKAGGG